MLEVHVWVVYDFGEFNAVESPPTRKRLIVVHMSLRCRGQADLEEPPP